MVFTSTDSLRCFECGDIGHLKRACPHKEKGENEPECAPNSQASAEPRSQPNGDPGEGTSRAVRSRGVSPMETPVKARAGRHGVSLTCGVSPMETPVKARAGRRGAAESAQWRPR